MNSYAKKWVRNLARYKQDRGFLKTDRGYCCLGVACKILGLEPELSLRHESFNRSVYIFENETSMLPEKVRQKLNLRTKNGVFVVTPEVRRLLPLHLRRHDALGLDDLNDDGVDFKTIAKIIRMEPPGLFNTQKSLKEMHRLES